MFVLCGVALTGERAERVGAARLFAGSCGCNGPLPRLIARIAAYLGVVTVASHLCLRVVHDGSSWVPGILNNKVPSRIAKILERGGPPPRRVTRTEQAILPALGRDGRASFSRLAELSGLTESTVRRHLHELGRVSQ